MSDPRAPVIAGAGQISRRAVDGGPSPLDFMVHAACAAAEDAGPGGETLLARAASVGVVDCFSWPVSDPGAALAHELGIAPRETVVSARGGTGPLELLGDLCARIRAGELDVALLAGGEAVNPFMRAIRDGRPTGWGDGPGSEPSRVVGADRPANHAAEEAAGLIAPIFFYPLIESAVRGAARRSSEAHRRWLGELWDRFAAVAEDNPHAWTREPPRGAEALATASEANRMVADPYTKLLTANIQVDQGAALLLCSAQAAQDAGIAPERLVHVHATAKAHDHWFVSERDALHRSPAIAACGRAALGHAGAGIDDVAHLDLYSCFPSAVQIAAAELGIDLDRDARAPTVTGGLTFAGGPANDYATHALATMTGRLREDPDALGLSTAVGWYLTKHAVAVLSARAPVAPFRHHDVQAQVDALPRRRVAEGATGDATVEAYTAVHDRDGTPTLAIVTCLVGDDEARAPARSEDPATIAALLDGEPLGRTVRLDGAAGFAFG